MQQRRSTPREPAPPVAPGVITRIAPTQRDPERVSVFIDETFAFALPAILVAQRGLKRGDDLDEDAVRELEGIAVAERATEAALTFVSYRPRSEREVRDRLRRRAYPPAAIDYAIEKLRGWRYLDDKGFAEFWVENRVEHSPRGRRALASELAAKGVDRTVAGEVLDNAELNEEAAALELARKRLRSLANLDPQTRRRRLSDYLARRGYGWDVVRPVLREVLDETDDDDERSADDGAGPLPSHAS
ncbi:MAG TPA: regulatory protein RecX [Thermomicrobiales bacterium]|nr:regulatory protein RecX [Thermomicrobiales bacterium]